MENGSNAARSGTRIAIVRLTSLGDVIHGLPLAAALREHRPDASIVWIVEEREQILVRGNPLVDRVVVAPLRRWRRSAARGHLAAVLREARGFRAELAELSIQVAIDLQGWAHKSSPIVALTRAPMRIGFSRSHARSPWSTLFTTHHVTPPPAAAHVVDQNLLLLEPLGIRSPRVRFVFPEWAEAEARVADWMAEHRGAQERPIVLLPSTRGRRKFWPAASYAELARRLAAVASAPLVAAGSPGERPLLDDIQRRAGVPRLQVYAPAPIADLARFLAHAALVIGNDTGPLHLAAAASVPSIGLFGPTRGARNGPYGPTGHYIQSPSGRMADIPVDEVFAAATRLLRQ